MFRLKSNLLDRKPLFLHNFSLCYDIVACCGRLRQAPGDWLERQIVRLLTSRRRAGRTRAAHRVSAASGVRLLSAAQRVDLRTADVSEARRYASAVVVQSAGAGATRLRACAAGAGEERGGVGA